MAVVEDLALDPEARDRVVHPVEATKEGRLAAARGADQRRDLAAADPQGDIGQGLFGAIEDVHFLRVEDDIGGDVDVGLGGALGGGRRTDHAGQGLGADAHPAGCRRFAVGGRRGVESLVVDAHRVNFLLLRLRRAREPRPRTRIIAIRINERPQASVKPSGFASSDNWKIRTGTFGRGWPKRVELEGVALAERADQQDRCRLAGGAGDRKEGRGDDPAERGREDDRQDAAPAGDAERVGSFSLGAGDEPQHLLRTAGDQRHLDDRKGDRGGEARLASSSARRSAI